MTIGPHTFTITSGPYAGTYKANTEALELLVSLVPGALENNDGSAIAAFIVAGTATGRIEIIKLADSV